MKHRIPEISTQELADRLGDGKTSVVDVRPVEAYNGWSNDNESRSGHITGARSLPWFWAEYIDWIEIVRAKGLLPDRMLIAYGEGPEEILQVANRFRRAGYRDVRVYRHFTDEWSPDTDLPMERLPKFQKLVYPAWLKTLLSGGRPPLYHGKRFVVCHVHYRNREDYLSGHIPGAVELDTLALESPQTWNRRPPEELRAALQAMGITHDTTVILYGRFSFPDKADPFPGSSAGHLGAIRCAFIMMYAGVKDVRVLNGGIASWENAGCEITSEPTLPSAVPDFGEAIPGHPEFAVDMPEARKLLRSKHGELVSIRSWPEFTGEESGYNYIEKKGRIPGAIFGNCGSDAYHMENYRNLDYTTREFGEIAEAWKDAGITPDKHIAFYCGTGWRGSEAFFNAYLMGWPRISVFDGGWFEWSNDPENPIETGVPGQAK